LDQQSARTAISLSDGNQPVAIDIGFTNQGSSAVIYPRGVLEHNTTYTLKVSDQLKGADGSMITSQNVSFRTIVGELTINSIEIGGTVAGNTVRLTDVPLHLDVILHFSAPLLEETVKNAVSLSGNGVSNLQASISNDKRKVHLTTPQPLDYLSKYELT